MKKTLALIAATTTLLSGCGGGGGGTTAAPLPPVALPLAAYVGEWIGDCANHQRDGAVVKAVGNNALSLAARTDYYDKADCSGAIVATQTASADIGMSYVSTVDSNVALGVGVAAKSIKVDQINVVVPSSTATLSGSGVSTVTQNGVQQQCVSFSNGERTCVNTQGSQVGGSGPGGLYATATELYTLIASGGGYSFEQRFNKK
ncbi:hypothetical protein ACFOLJ_19070 [Rugamonas sp. CCM 8940]|uniref:hypothetical protein n=1 Tax=Rugamonas sp. CCM 8940 TaxID=2765359 RepID=UPI0018F4F287|nr:hypothetical protein [Rugamonas sp. CCM 8940]MBJ7309565.1 hypothetical protein [Rugamonas sp. CCM 8940]